MKQLFSIFLCCLTSLLCAQNKTIALSEPRIGEGSTEISGMEKAMVRGELRKAIVNISGYEAVTRQDIDQMMKEHDFQRTGLVNSEQIKKLGILSGADFICVATLTKSNTEFYLEAYLINLETGAMSNPASQYGELLNGKIANLFPACQALAKELLSGNVPTATNSLKYDMPTNNNTNYYSETTLGLNLKMIYVEGGNFMMGCGPEQGNNCYQNEQPSHSVSLNSFYISALEITQSQWEKVMGISINEQKEQSGYSRLYGVGSNYPMYYVSWNDAMKFCKQLSKKTGKNYTLPTEAQWEYAARGGTYFKDTRYAGAKTIDDVAWASQNSQASAHQCGAKNANELGIYDMSGNITEWCLDWYDDYDTYNITDPVNNERGTFKVLRGGCWDSKNTQCRVSSREFDKPQTRHYNYGFRIVCLP